jgi:hypothetical protein
MPDNLELPKPNHILTRRQIRGVPTMAGDPKLCRQYALDCAAMAARATNPDHKRLFTNLAQTWLSLAIELETSIALLDAYAPDAANRKEA